MRKSRKLLILILLMAIGFATVTTTLFINGSTIISVNQSDFKVLFTKTVLDDVKDNSLIVDDTHIVFTTNELKNIGDKSILVYTIKNNSRNYDALLNMTFSPETTEYIRVTNTLEKNTLESDETTTGTLTVELIKGYIGENALEQSITVEINASAVEKNTLGDVTSSVRVLATNTNGQDVYVSSETIVGNKKEEIVEQLRNANIIAQEDSDDKILQVTNNDLSNVSTMIFNVSEIANNGDNVVLLHYDETNDSWEYLGQDVVEDGIIECDLSTNAPVVFAVKQANGDFQITKLHEYIIKSGNLDTPGSIVCIGDDDFYVVGSDENNDVVLLKATRLGTDLVAFSSTMYWYDYDKKSMKDGYTNYDIYDSNSKLYQPINDYLNTLKIIDGNVKSARLLKVPEYNNIKGSEWLNINYSWWLDGISSVTNVFVYEYSYGKNSFTWKQFDNSVNVYIRPVIILKR